MFPARSTARTANVWLPSAKPLKVTGSEQGENAASPSNWHSNDAPASSDEKSKVAPVELVTAGGPESMRRRRRKGPYAPAVVTWFQHVAELLG